MVVVALLTSIGLICGLAIYIAYRVLPAEPESFKKIEKISANLPAANCGACGYPGCFAYAQALAEDKQVFINSPCPGVMQSPKMLAALKEMLDLDIDASAVRNKAVVACSGDGERIGEYSGVKTCKAATLLLGGYKRCPYGCLGLGDCVEVCPEGAIHIDPENDVAVVDPAKCTGCGLCVKECPRGIIHLVPENSKVVLLCSYDAQKNIPGRGRGPHGCLHCKKCMNVCQYEAVTWDDARNFPVFNAEKCTLCGECLEACPNNCLLLFHDDRPPERHTASSTSDALK